MTLIVKIHEGKKSLRHLWQIYKDKYQIIYVQRQTKVQETKEKQEKNQYKRKKNSHYSI